MRCPHDIPFKGNAENMQAAEKLLEGCPIITSVRVYEALSM